MLLVGFDRRRAVRSQAWPHGPRDLSRGTLAPVTAGGGQSEADPAQSGKGRALPSRGLQEEELGRACIREEWKTR